MAVETRASKARASGTGKEGPAKGSRPRGPSWAQRITSIATDSPGRAPFLLYVAVFIDLFAVALIIPTFSTVYKRLDLGPVMFGALGTVYGAVQFICNPIMGRLSDSHGRKRVLLVSFAGSAIGYFLLGAANSVAVLIVSRVIVGCVKQTMTIAASWVTDVTLPSERVGGLAQVRTAVSLGFIVGPAVGGIIAGRVSPLLPASLAVLLYAVDFVLVYLYLPDPPAHRNPAKPTGGNGAVEQVKLIVRLLSRQDVGFILVTRFLLQLSAHIGRFGLHIYMEEMFGLGSEYAAYAMSVAGTSGAIHSGITIPLLHAHFPERYVLPVSGVGLILAQVLTSFQRDYYVFLAMLFVISLTQTLLSTNVLSKFTQCFPRTETGISMGVGGSVQSIASVCAPLIGGVLTRWFGIGSPKLFAAFMVVVAGMIFYCAPVRECKVDVIASSDDDKSTDKAKKE